MAQIVTVPIQAAQVTVEAGVGAYDPSLAEAMAFPGSGDPIPRGEYRGLRVYDSVGIGATATFGVFTDALLTDLIHQFSVAFGAAAGSDANQLDLPAAFFANLYVACWTPAGGESLRVVPDIGAIAGRNP